jgi:hypothetical protein
MEFSSDCSRLWAEEKLRGYGRAFRALPYPQKSLARALEYARDVDNLYSAGRRTVNLLPNPTTLSAAMVPPWASTISLVMASPSPAPRLRA